MLAKIFRLLFSLASLALLIFLFIASMQILLFILALILVFALLWQIPFFRNWILLRFHSLLSREFSGEDFENHFAEEEEEEFQVFFENPFEEPSAKDITKDVKVIEEKTDPQE